jgi:hypothetical protein
MSNKKVFSYPFTLTWLLVLVQGAEKHRAYMLTVVMGNLAGLAIPCPIVRSKYVSNWASIGLDGSMRTTEVEGS